VNNPHIIISEGMLHKHNNRERPYAIPFISSYSTLENLEDNDAGDDADDEEEFADEYTVTPAMLDGLLELERTLSLSESAAGK
jgi:hypothetical protein